MREDFYWLNKDSVEFLKRGYLQEGVEPKERIKQIADSVERISGQEGISERFYSYMSKGWISMSSPIWSNFGLEHRGYGISCYGITIQDSTSDILRGVAEIGMMSKYGGGTAVNFSNLRGRGKGISGGGVSNGVMSFLDMYQSVTDTISQNGVRRGSVAIYLDIDHEDIDEYLTIRDEDSPIQNLSFAVNVSDEWMQSMIDGDSNKRKVWSKVLKKREETGYPYIQFSGNVNNNKPQVYKDKDLEITHSNLCVSGDTHLLTSDGYREIETLVGTYQNVWNGKNFEQAYVAKTGIGQKLYKVEVGVYDNITYEYIGNQTLKCTEYHKWIEKNKPVHTKDLRPTMILDSFKTPEGEEVYLAVIGVELMEGLHDTFCVNEPKEGKAMFNGVLTFNCNEIQLHSSETESFVCCISSVNLEHFDEWKDDPNFIFDFMVLLDSVMKEFIQKASGVPFFEKAVAFAINQNAVGLGVLGLHSYLQKNMIPFEGLQCKMKLNQIFKHLEDKTLEASKELAKIYGEPPLLKGYGERFTTRMAIAPTTSSSFILGQVSPSIEPLNSNYFLKDVAKGRYAYRNPYLEQLLESKGLNTFETWESILKNGGSVQHLDSLSQEEKEVFKTFDEISQLEVVQNVSIMQKYVDQGISMNVKIHPDTPVKDINALIIEGWRLGVKGFYYNRSTNKAQELGRKLISCSSCEA